MRDSLRAVLSLQSRKIGQPRFPSFSSGFHVGADTGLTLSVVYLDDLYKEANELFWKTTGYKVGQKLDPNNPEDAKMTATWSALLGQITAAHINKDTNDNFWKQTNYKVGQKLDPKIAADKAKIPIWISINSQVKTAYSKLPRNIGGIAGTVAYVAQQVTSAASTLVPVVTQAEVHATQAEVHQTAADNTKVQAAEAAKVAVEAAAAGDTAKAEEHTAISNALNAKADAHQEQADVHKDIVQQLIDIHSLSALAYLAAKSWKATPNHSKYFGWAIKEDGNVDTKWSDSLPEMKTWFDSLGFTGFIWGLYWDKDKVEPVEEYALKITQAQADLALNNALGKAKTIAVSLKDTSPASYASPTPQAQKAGGGGGAVALMVVLGGGIALAAASSKKR